LLRSADERAAATSVRLSETESLLRSADERVAATSVRLTETEGLLRSADECAAKALARLSDTTSRIGDAEQRASFAKQRGDAIATRVQILEAYHRQAHPLLQAMVRSTSWRITRPARLVAAALRGHAIDPDPTIYLPAIPSQPDLAPNPPKKAWTQMAVEDAPSTPLSLRHISRVEKTTTPGPAPIIGMLVVDFDAGGLERFVLDLCRALSRLDLCCAIFVTGRSGAMAQEAARWGVEVHACENGEAVASIARRLGIRAVVAHHCATGWNELHAAGIPIIEVLHNAYFWQRDDDGLRTKRLLISRFIAVSEEVREFAVQELDIDDGRILLLLNGVDVSEFFRPRFARLCEIRGQEEFTFLQVSQLWHSKGHNAALTAFAKLHQEFPATRLVFAGGVGEVEVETLLRQRVRMLELEGVVQFTGWLDRRDISRYYASANCFLLPSFNEGFSLATIEALFFGLPMILTDVGGAREVIQHEDVGILIHPPTVVNDLTFENRRALSLMDDPGHVGQLHMAMRQMVSDRELWARKGLDGMAKFPTFDMGTVGLRYEAALAPYLARTDALRAD
jgi:glycosyltransferase involved in cell wall biosynthesis